MVASLLSIIAAVLSYSQMRSSDCFVAQYYLKMAKSNGVELTDKEKKNISQKKERKKSWRGAIASIINVSVSSLELGYVTVTDTGCIVHVVHYLLKKDLHSTNGDDRNIQYEKLANAFIDKLYVKKAKQMNAAFNEHFSFDHDTMKVTHITTFEAADGNLVRYYVSFECKSRGKDGMEGEERSNVIDTSNKGQTEELSDHLASLFGVKCDRIQIGEMWLTEHGVVMKVAHCVSTADVQSFMTGKTDADVLLTPHGFTTKLYQSLNNQIAEIFRDYFDLNEEFQVTHNSHVRAIQLGDAMSEISQANAPQVEEDQESKYNDEDLCDTWVMLCLKDLDDGLDEAVSMSGEVNEEIDKQSQKKDEDGHLPKTESMIIRNTNNEAEESQLNES
eukprot:657364_1